MRRLALVTAAGVVFAGVAVPALASEPMTRTPGPTPAAVAPASPAPTPASPSPTPTASLSPTVSPPRDTATVCAVTAKTVTDGLDRFVKEMEAVTAHADRDDLIAAEQAVRTAGAQLVSIGAQLRADVVVAEQRDVKATVTELANEFEKLGRSLTGLTALQTFDTTKLDQLADKMSVLCGESPSPGASISATPSPASPSPAAPSR